MDTRVHRSPAFITHPAEPTAGYVVEDVGDATDRPGTEFVFVARRL
ncbi:hypothetical protein [Streptomyces spongiicola]|nr:hypothetical protein [Streptomyces spongiicola]